MEYCHCGSVASYVRKGNRLNEEELREIACCCLLGLNYLHKMIIIHRVSILTRIDGMDIAFPVCIFILLFLFNMPDYHCFASKIVAL